MSNPIDFQALDLEIFTSFVWSGSKRPSNLQAIMEKKCWLNRKNYGAKIYINPPLSKPQVANAARQMVYSESQLFSLPSLDPPLYASSEEGRQSLVCHRVKPNSSADSALKIRQLRRIK